MVGTSCTINIKKNNKITGIPLYYDGYFSISGIYSIIFLKNPTLYDTYLSIILLNNKLKKSIKELMIDDKSLSNNVFIEQIHFFNNKEDSMQFSPHYYEFNINNGIFNYYYRKNKEFSINLYKSNLQDIYNKIFEYYKNEDNEFIIIEDNKYILDPLNNIEKDFTQFSNKLIDNLEPYLKEKFIHEKEKISNIYRKNMFETFLNCNKNNFEHKVKLIDNKLKLEKLDDILLYKYLLHFKKSFQLPSIDKKYDKIIYSKYCIINLARIYEIDIKNIGLTNELIRN